MLGDVTEPTAPFGLVDVQGDGSGIVEGRLGVEADLARRLRVRARALGVSAASISSCGFCASLSLPGWARRRRFWHGPFWANARWGRRRPDPGPLH